MTEKDYRASERLSYSAVKEFDTNRIKFYKKYILKEEDDEVPSTAILLGNLCDCKLFSPETFDDKFHIATCNKGSGQLWDAVDELCAITVKSLDKDLKVTRPFDEMLKEAFESVKYDKKRQEVKFKGKTFEWFVTNFTGSEAEAYYKECRSVFGKDVVDLNLISASEKIIEELQTCEWTKAIINAKTEEDIEVVDQLAILYDVQGVPFKGMPDRVIINHKDKTITPYDMKISYTGEDFGYNYWKMKYYLQVASYYLALHYWKKVDRPELADYDIPGIEFIVGSSTLQSNPLLYSTNQININEGLYGFTTKAGNRYKGLYELVKEIEWHKKEQVWRNSKEVYDNKGKMIIKPFEEI